MPCILTRCRAFVLPGDNTAPYKRLHRVLCCQCKLYHPHHKTAHRALQWLFLRFAPFNRPRYQTNKGGYNTTCDTLSRYPDTTATPGRCAGQHRPSIIIMYIRGCRGAPCYGSMPEGTAHRRPCQRRRVSVSTCTGSAVRAGRSGTLHPAGQSSSKGHGGRRGTIGGFRRISFRAFAR